MSYTTSELKPSNPVLIIDSTEIKLSLITFHISVTLQEKYESLAGTLEAINKNPLVLLDVIWILVIDKNKFDNSFDVFKKFIISRNVVERSKKMGICLNEAIYKAQPLIKNEKRQKEIDAIQETQTDKDPCYGVYYDRIAKRYNYTLNQFYELTLRQLHILLKVVDDESYKDLEVQAALNGRKLKPRMVFNDVTPEEEEEQTKDAMDAFEKLKKKYEANKKE